MAEQSNDIVRQKAALRREARAARMGQADRPRLSEAICRRAAGMPEYAAAATLMCYIGHRSEVDTRALLTRAWADNKRVVVPYCEADEIALFLLREFAELAPGCLGILEPTGPWRAREERRVEADRIDLLAVPGVAFDRDGGRLGQGKGYYDRFLGRIRADAAAVGLAFECQLRPALPLLPHDAPMDWVVTEADVYKGKGRASQ